MCGMEGRVVVVVSEIMRWGVYMKKRKKKDGD